MRSSTVLRCPRSWAWKLRTERKTLSFVFVLRAMKQTMQDTPAKLLDVIAVLADKPANGLVSGQVGTIVEVLAPGVFEVEFCNSEGRTLGFAELKREEFLVLRHEPALAA